MRQFRAYVVTVINCVLLAFIGAPYSSLSEFANVTRSVSRLNQLVDFESYGVGV